MMLLSQLRSILVTSRFGWDTRKKDVLITAKAPLMRWIISWWDLMCFPHDKIIVPCNTWCRHDGHGTLDFVSLINSTLTISIIDRHDLCLNIMFFSVKSLRIQIFFDSILILSITFVLISSFTAPIFDTMSMIFSFLRTAFVSMSEAICSNFFQLVLTSVESSESSCAPVQCSFTTFSRD